jgi:ABC-type sulfate transport system permease component
MGDVRRKILQRLILLLFMVLWVFVFVMLCKRKEPCRQGGRSAQISGSLAVNVCLAIVALVVDGIFGLLSSNKEPGFELAVEPRS